MKVSENPAAKAVLLLDEYTVSRTENCVQRFHSLTKDPSSPCITATEPWEARGPYTWGNRLLWNPDTKQYEIYYVAFMPDDNRYRLGLAVSDDGLEWHKPELYNTEFYGQPAKNMLEPLTASMVRDPRPECPADERYKAIHYPYNCTGRKSECIWLSPDGRSWREEKTDPEWLVPSDVIHTMWDPMREKFTAYFKSWEVTAETPDSSLPTGFRKIKFYCPSFDLLEKKDNLILIEAPVIHFNPESRATVERQRIWMRNEKQGSDDGGGGNLTGAWVSKRVVCWAESDDWRSWISERVILHVDEKDRPDSNIQLMSVIYYGGYYIGFMSMHDERGFFEQQLAFSFDGLNFKRPWRGDFIGLGQDDRFDGAMVTQPLDPILTPNQLIFYYGGLTMRHYQNMMEPWYGAIGRGFIRRDGFCSWEATDRGTGMLETTPIAVSGDRLLVNADAVGGWIAAEILDENGEVIPGFSRVCSLPFLEDSARFPDCMAEIGWRDGKSLADLWEKKVTVRFCFQNAKLYSYLV